MKNVSTKTNRRIFHGHVAPRSSPEPLKIHYSIDIHTLERDLDRRIMADKDKGQVMSPRDLYVRSNPGLLGTGQDMTNPREWYNSKTSQSLMNTFANQDTNAYHHGGKKKPNSVPHQPTVAFLVNFPTLSSSSSAMAYGHGDSTHGEQTTGDRTLSDNHRYKKQKPLPQIKQKEVWGAANGSDVVHKQTLDYHGGFDRTFENKENDPIDNGLPPAADDDHLPPIGEPDVHDDYMHNSERLKKDNAFTLPRLSKQEIVIPKHNVRRNKNTEKTHQWYTTTMPEETLRQAQIRAGLDRDLKTERKALSTNNSHDPESFQTYTEKYMELRIPKAHRSERNMHENLHKTYHMKQKSVLKLKLTYDDDQKPKKQRKQRMGYEQPVSGENPDYSSVKSKLSDYIHKGTGEKVEKEPCKSFTQPPPPPPPTHHRPRDPLKPARLGPASHVSYRKPQFSLGPNSKPITPLDKYNAETFPLVMDEVIGEVQRENQTDTRQALQSSSNTKYLSNTSAHKVTAVKREKTKASVVNLGMSNAPSTVDYGDHDDTYRAGPDSASIIDGSTLWHHSDIHGSISQIGGNNPSPASASSKPATLSRQPTTLARFTKLEVFGERQPERGQKKKAGGETIESTRGTLSICPPYLLDPRDDQVEAESELSSHLQDNTNRRVSTVTVGTDISDSGTPRTTGDNFPKSRGPPASLTSRQKSNAMAPLMEKSFISEGPKLGVVSTIQGTQSSDVEVPASTEGELTPENDNDIPKESPQSGEPLLVKQKSDIQIVLPTNQDEEKATASTVPTNSVSPNTMALGEQISSQQGHIYDNASGSYDPDSHGNKNESPAEGTDGFMSPVPSEACRLQKAPSMSSAGDGNEGGEVLE